MTITPDIWRKLHVILTPRELNIIRDAIYGVGFRNAEDVCVRYVDETILPAALVCDLRAKGLDL